MAKHRKFNADRFLDKFQGQESVLRSYVCRWEGCRKALPARFGIGDFKTFLAGDDIEGKDELVEGLYRAHDLSTEDGHEYLVCACKEDDRNPDPEGSLPVECLALKVLTESEGTFHFAYDMHTVSTAEKFAIYRGRRGQTIQDPEGAAERLEKLLANAFANDKQSNRVIVRRFDDGQRVNFVIYHEKRTRAHLTFRRGRGKSGVTPLVFRPAQQDLICYDWETGTAEIETRSLKGEEVLRRAFASSCLGDETVFEDEDASKQVDLTPVQNERFNLTVDDGHIAALVEIHAQLRQRYGPTLVIKSKDTLSTLRSNNLHRLITNGIVRKVVIKFQFGDDRRGRRVEVALPNRLRFKRATHADLVFGYLRRWRLLRE